MPDTTSIGRCRFQWAATVRTSSSLTQGPCSRWGLEDEADRSSMSPLPISRSAPGWSRMTRLSASEDTEKAMREGILALITPVIDVHRRALGGQHQVDAHGPGHLGDPAHRLLDVPGRHHHQVVELVHHDQDERQPLVAELGLFLLVVTSSTVPRIRSR